jgi:hypothetical protein
MLLAGDHPANAERYNRLGSVGFDGFNQQSRCDPIGIVDALNKRIQ